ncbi:MAG: MATE family efflux transporter [Oscillospiraceae bacterium]
MEQKNDFLEREPVGRLMRKYAVPCIISLLVAALYNIVDQIFIANASYLGSYGNAANTVVFPLTVVALAIAVMIGDGCCAYVSISLGAKETKRAGDSVGSAVLLSILAGVVILAAYLLFQKPLLTLFGATVNQETYAQSQEYFFYITLGIPFYVFGQAMNPIIRSDGSPKFAMASTLAGAALNIVLDPIFIFPLRWGMMGAAVATVLGQVLTAVLSAAYLFRMKSIHLSRANFRFHPRLMKHYLPLGICSFLSQISLVASMAAVNNMVRKYGALDPVFGQAEYAQIPMAVIGIVMKFFQIVISIVVGMAAGCIPIVGYNVGAGRNDRAKALFTRLLASEAILGVIALLIVELLPRQIIGIFGASGESEYYTLFAIRCFRVYLCMIIPACINKASFIFLQSLGKPWISTFLSMLREVVFGVGFALLLPLWFGLDGVLYSMPVSDALTFLVSLAVIVSTYRELNRASGEDASPLAAQ